MRPTCLSPTVEGHRVWSVGPDGRGVITERRPQEPERLTQEQRDLDHMMRCTKNGCVRCA